MDKIPIPMVKQLKNNNYKYKLLLFSKLEKNNVFLLSVQGIEP